MTHAAKIPALLAAACCWLTWGTLAAEEKGPSGDRLRFVFAVELAEAFKPLGELETNYQNALKREEDRAKSVGNLETLLAIRKELEGFRAGPAKEIATREELRKLREIYDKERTRLLGEINTAVTKKAQTYQTKLSELMTELTKADQIDEALELKKEIERLEAILFVSPHPGTDLYGSYVKDEAIAAAASSPSPVGNSTGRGSVALPGKTTGRIRSFGTGRMGSFAIPPDIAADDNFVAVRTVWNRCAALRSDGSVVVIPGGGPFTPPADLKPAVRVRISVKFVIAFHADQMATVWGAPDNPATDLPPTDLGPVRDLAADGSSGIALLPDGQIRVWGSMYPDEAARRRIESQFPKVDFIGASGGIAWVATEKGEVFSWEESLSPKKHGTHRSISQFEASHAYYIVLDDRGKVSVTSRWAREPHQNEAERLSGVRQVRTSWACYSCQLADGSWRVFNLKHEPTREKVESLGPVPDLDVSLWTSNSAAVWLE